MTYRVSFILISEDGCFIVYEENSSKLYFKVLDQKLMKKTGEVKYTMLECADITAADLKVTSKFGSWDTMTCRLVVECANPLTTWKSFEIDKPIPDPESGKNKEFLNELLQGESNPKLSPEGGAPVQTAFVAVQQESCMVKAAFDIHYITDLRDILHSVKVAKLKDRKCLQEKHKKGIDKHIIIPTKIREGLPEWVHYIPAKWYSSTVRKVIEYMLVVYTVLTLLWAVWQLYKHVDFIRRYLRPIFMIIEYYLEMLKSWFRWLDKFAEALTDYWWTYMKPVYLLATPLYVSLASLFKPLRNVAGLISSIFEPVVKFFKTIASVLRPLVQPAVSVFSLFIGGIRKFLTSVMGLWSMVLNTTMVKLVIDRSNQMGLSRIIHEITHGGLDPLKAQVVVVRDLLLRSTKQIFYGLRFIMSRIYFMFVFMKRERKYAKEGRANEGREKVE